MLWFCLLCPPSADAQSLPPESVDSGWEDAEIFPGAERPPQIRDFSAEEKARLSQGPRNLSGVDLDFIRQKIAILEASYGPEHPRTLYEKYSAIVAFLVSDEYENALSFAQDVAPYLASTFGTGSDEFRQAQIWRGVALAKLKQFPEAIAVLAPVAKAPVKHSEDKELASDMTIQAQEALGSAQLSLGRSADALQSYERALSLGRAEAQSDDDVRARLEMGAARALAQLKQSGQAVQTARLALRLFYKAHISFAQTQLLNPAFAAIWRSGQKIFGIVPDSGVPKAYLTVMHELVQADSRLQSVIEPEAFEAAQLVMRSHAGQSMLEAMARVKASPSQRTIIDERTEIAAKLQKTYEVMLSGRAEGAHLSRDQAVTEEIGRLQHRYGVLNQALQNADPNYFSSVVAQTIGVQPVQERLGPNQGLLLIFDVDSDIHVMVVTGKGIKWHRVRNGRDTAKPLVRRLLCEVDETACRGGEVPMEEYDAATAFRLYDLLLGEVTRDLPGIDHLFVLSSGVMGSLPLGILTTGQTVLGKPPAWLADRFSLTLIPDVSAFVSSKSRPVSVQPSVAFVGYGNPKVGVGAGSFGNAPLLAWSAKDAALLANRSELLALDELPDTQEELVSLATLFGMSLNQAVKTRDRDDEGEFKKDPLVAQARVLSIATHAVTTKLSEPLNPKMREVGMGLVFTPPPVATPANDGLLTPAEIAPLKISADWVILSACETINSDVGGEALSSIARAFLFAGAKSLLATHWRISDNATPPLILAIISRYENGPEEGHRAKALQAAVRFIRTTKPEFAHPRYWGAFSIVAADE